MTRWKPNVTVAAIVEQDGRYLMVEEQTPDGIRFNQPAGHLEQGETLIAAVEREVAEETGWQVRADALVGIYQVAAGEITYLRFCFACTAVAPIPDARLDDGIIAAHWIDADTIESLSALHRGPAVQACLDDARRGLRHPLTLLATPCAG